MKYRKKPIVIDAIQFNGENASAIFALATDQRVLRSGSGLLIETLEGTMEAAVGDWIIRGVEGELYPCKPSVFAKTYEEAP